MFRSRSVPFSVFVLSFVSERRRAEWRSLLALLMLERRPVAAESTAS
jgi:hypothetical protein